MLNYYLLLDFYNLVIRKFQIHEKLSRGKLKESDFRKKQLYVISLQFGEGDVWLTQLLQNLTLSPSHEKIARYFLTFILS